MIDSFYLLGILAKNTLEMFGRILRTPLPIVMNTSDIKTSSQQTLVALNLVFGIILIFTWSISLQVRLTSPKKNYPKYLLSN